MKNTLIGILGILILISIFPIFNINAEGLSKPSGTSLKATLYLYGSNNEFGKMIYNRSGQYLEYVFNAHNLLPNTKYNLIYYPQKPIGLICIGEGVTNSGGQLNITEKEIHITSIPFNSDINGDTQTTTYQDGTTGGKIWLVLSEQVNCSTMKFTTNILTNVLYEDTLIYFWKI